MALYEKRNYFIGLTALLISLISLYLSDKAIDSSWEIARVSGSLNVSNINVGIGGNSISENGIVQLVLGASHVSDDDSVAIGEIPFTFSSSGQKTIDDLTITFQYHKMFKRNVLENMAFSASGVINPSLLKRSITESDTDTFSTYSIDTLNPGVTLSINEPLYLTDTSVDLTVPAKTKDGVNVSASFRMEYALKYGFTLHARNILLRSVPVEMSVMKASSVQEIIDKKVFNMISEARTKVRNNVSFVTYLSSLLFHSPKNKIYVVYSSQERVSKNNMIIYGPSEKPESAVVTFDLQTWELLFAN